jgi:exopolyphosphatase/guanosine-5'-triphosphate,3'-diphosphate pyrophosphatase
MVGAVDIGTNSMRLLITDGVVELGRWVEVTGLGSGIDATGRLADDAIGRTISVLGRYGALMDDRNVSARKAIATSASRDASNRDSFFDQAEVALGVRPTLITGDEEARLAYLGATSEEVKDQPLLVSDIGGGSTEFVTSHGSVSVDIGSVRLTERSLPERPSSEDNLSAARELVLAQFAGVDVGPVRTLVGVAGTWTSLGAMALGLPSYDRDLVHGTTLTRDGLEDLIGRLASMSVEETATIPSLDPKRAPVILAGAVVAAAVLDSVGVGEATISERDTLDAVAAELLA